MAVAAALTVTACKKEASTPTTTEAQPAAAAPTGPTNAELKIGISQEFENLNPVIAQMLATSYLYKISGRNLDTINAAYQWVPQIVESIPTIENGQARFVTVNGVKTIEADWVIREGASWGDGTPVTGHDVAFGIKVGQNDNVAVGEKEVYTQVKEVVVDKENPRKFKFIYDKLRWDFNHIGTMYILPKHLEEPIFNKYVNEPQGYEKNTLYTTQPTNPGLYNGPYRVSEIKLGSHIVFVPNEKWTFEKPKIQKIIVKTIPNTATLEANLVSGTIDKIAVLGFTFDQALSFEKVVKRDNLPYNVNFKPGLTYEHVDVQLTNPILKDIKVRKALVHGLNRDELTKALFEDRQKKALHNFTPNDPWYSDKPEDIVLYPYSLEEAGKLLDEAGWKLSPDGFRYKGKDKLSLTIMTTAGNKTRELVQTYIQDQWKKIGVELTIRNEPARVFFGETVRKGQYPHLAMFAWISSPENSPKSQSSSKNIPLEANGFSGQNSGGWRNAEVDAMLEKLDGEFNHDERLKILKKYLYHYTNEVPVIPLYYRAEVSVTPKNLTGYELTGHQFSETNWIETWSLGQ